MGKTTAQRGQQNHLFRTPQPRQNTNLYKVKLRVRDSKRAITTIQNLRVNDDSTLKEKYKNQDEMSWKESQRSHSSSLQSNFDSDLGSSDNSHERKLEQESQVPKINLDKYSTISHIKSNATKFFSRIKKHRKKGKSKIKKEHPVKIHIKMGTHQLKKRFQVIGLAQLIRVYKSITISEEDAGKKWTSSIREAFDFEDFIPESKPNIFPFQLLIF